MTTYKCTVCEKLGVVVNYTSLAQLAGHRELVHVYKCFRCFEDDGTLRQFDDRSVYDTHTATCRGWNCVPCSKSFETFGGLSQHRKIDHVKKD